MFCAPGLVLCRTECVGSCFQVLRAWNRFRLYRGSRVPFACFARHDSFSTVVRASGPVFMFCALGLVFGGTEGVGSRFHVLCAQTNYRRRQGLQMSFSCFALPDSFRRYRERRVPFSCFALLDSFSAIPRASSPVFKFCAQNHFRRYRGSRVSFSSFARMDLFSAVPRALTEGVGSRSQVLRARTLFDGKEGVGPYFHVLGARTHFPRYRGRQLPFSCFACTE
jgi:hypothetical protein